MCLILTTIPRMRVLLFQRLLLLSICFPLAAALPQAPAVTATVDVAKTGAPISKNIYGQFLEHGGDIVNTGIWSEMLVDRKFFYPVATAAPTPPPAMGNAAGNPRFQNVPKRWWVARRRRQRRHDGQHRLPTPATSRQPCTLPRPSRMDLRQSGLVVQGKKTYSGRIVLAGTPGAVVQGRADRRAAALPARRVITLHRA